MPRLGGGLLFLRTRVRAWTPQLQPQLKLQIELLQRAIDLHPPGTSVCNPAPD